MAPVAVHVVPDVDNIHRRTDGHGLGNEVTEYRTACGAQTVWRSVRKPSSHLVSSDDFGVHLFGTYAAAIGAHYCRRCWPELKASTR